MRKCISLKIPAAVSRIAFSALLFITMAAATLHLGAPTAQAAQAALSWTAPATNTDGTSATNLAGYKLHIGSSPGNYQQNIDVGNLTSYSDSSLNDGSTYYFAVTAYNASGVESANSNEVSKSFPAVSHLITATAGSGGTITALNNTKVNTAASGTTTVTSVTVGVGASQAFSIAAATGYSIAGVTVDGASVGPVASYSFSNVEAAHTIQASFAASSAGSGASLALNSGGSAYKDAAGVSYLADASFSGGSAGTTNVAISGTVDDILYQTERWGSSSYNIPMANGNYALTLKFAETYWSAAGKRIFDVTVGGKTVISGLDIYAKAGKDAAYDVVVPVSVTNGTLSVAFVSKVDNAKICAIMVSPASSTATSFSITASAGAGGSITPAAATTLTSGASQSYAIAAAAGYGIADVKVDGVSVGPVAAYSFTSITSNHTIAATFATKSYTITASAGTGGSISPAGATALSYGSSQNYTVTAAAGYSIAGVTVDGASVGPVASYSFTTLAANHTIQASFTASSAGTGASFALNTGGSSFKDAAGVSYLADANFSGGSAGTTNVAISGTVDGALYQTERWGSSSYNIPMANGNYALTLKFAETYWSAAGKRIFDVTVGGKTVISGLDIYAKAGKDAAYDVVVPVSVTNGTLSVAFVSKVDNAKICAIRVSPASSFSITASAGAGGSITPAATTTLTSGASQSYAIAAAAGYRIGDVKVDGVSVGPVASYSFTTLAANHTIQASFAASSAGSGASFALNAGGSGYKDAAGITYLADASFSGGSAGTTNVAISGTVDDALYQTERWGNSSYNMPMANGNYELTLKFAETYWSAAGKRIFDVTVGGKTVLSGLDIYAKAGKDAAYDVVVPVSVTNGTLSVAFVNKVDNAKICAIKVRLL
jgi:hypothetical protein